MKTSFGVVLIAFMALALTVSLERPRAAGNPPAWAYAVAPGTPAARAGGAAAGAPGAGARAGGGGRGGDPTPLTLPGAKVSFTRGQVGDGFNPADWFPEDHPPMPEVVAHGHRPDARACAYCHLANGKGRPENAPLAGLPKEYILQQLSDFRNGLRKGAEPRKEDFMLPVAKSLSEPEMREVAEYFSSMKPTPWIRVIEANTIPTVRIAGGMFIRVDDGTTEPIGMRVVESPEDTAQSQLRSPRSGFLTYVPVGSIKKGEEIVRTGAKEKTIACATCHGPDLRGIGPIPPIAGRSPSYVARQLFDIQQGTRNGAMAALMKPVVANLTEEDMVAIVAYTASLAP